uniref:Uncharacterized protein n=1 Tax=Oryza glaberrima TaxID=4538 RepID=I1QBC4_ORYGL
MVTDIQQHYSVESPNTTCLHKGYGIKDTVVVHPKTDMFSSIVSHQKKIREATTLITVYQATTLITVYRAPSQCDFLPSNVREGMGREKHQCGSRHYMWRSRPQVTGDGDRRYVEEGVNSGGKGGIGIERCLQWPSQPISPYLL